MSLPGLHSVPSHLAAALGGDAFHVPAQEFLSFGRHIGETHANAETRRGAGDLSVQAQLGFAQPERLRKPVSTGRGMGISTKQPPTLKSEALPQITGCPSQCSSTEIEHFIRGERRRSTAERKVSTAMP